MNTPTAILIGFALVAAAVYFSRDVGPARAASGSPNFSIVDAGTETLISAWVLNNTTGKVNFCAVGTVTSTGKTMIACNPQHGK